MYCDWSHRQAKRCPVALRSSGSVAHSALATPAGASIDQQSCDQRLWELAQTASLEELMASAAALRDEGHQFITFSPKVFLPLTRLCRDSCGYCTFALPPSPGRRAYMTLEEILEVARAGAQQGCTEALFTLGDKPELLYPEAAAELRSLGFTTTLEYVAEAAKVVMRQTGLLPHINAGVMGLEDVLALRKVSAGQGLMLESTSLRLMQPGGAHFHCPDKEPAARLATIEAAGQAQVPYTSGILIGIGETREKRVEALLAIRQLHQQYGHIQEVIIQNFVPKKGTAMVHVAGPPLEDLLWTVAVARHIFGPGMNIQAPPNLTPGDNGQAVEGAWRALLDAGINDWGGISPLTRDYVNPEKAWPHLQPLAAATAAAGKALLPRLTTYPEHVQDPWRWFDATGGRSSVAAAVLRLADSDGLARGSDWLKQGTWRVAVGADGLLEGCPGPEASPRVLALLHRVQHQQHQLTEDEIASLFSARGADFRAICHAADALRQRQNDDVVSYAVNRNINYTNVCLYACQFCAFSKGKAAEDLRGAPYLLDLGEISRRTAEAWDRGATEVCMQGGIHPDFTGDTYLRILEAAKAGAPSMHVHAFSPLEVTQGAATLNWPLERFLAALKEAGLGSLPGTAAEVLDDEVRAELCPDKLSTAEWLQVVEAAHRVGLRTSSTIMFGHCDTPRSWARHLVALRGLQSRTGGITEFVPLPFVHMEAPIYLKGRARRGPSLRECILMHAVGRLALSGFIHNIQASWVKMGPERAAQLLSVGCNDMGGSIMNESITKAAGASHGQELPPERMEALIKAAGRTPRQRTTVYADANPAQRAKSFGAAELSPLVFGSAK
ncbi:hypothetical protein WJX72_009860 [[Myrmecia] bisecta]|uniref:FO synthase n=1 Tax=[Myrmecia] bisecta TaxID=41462 RepID=A0AAW1P5S2_9CHLO